MNKKEFVENEKVKKALEKGDPVCNKELDRFILRSSLWYLLAVLFYFFCIALGLGLSYFMINLLSNTHFLPGA